MENSLPVSNPPTVDDALREVTECLEGGNGNLSIIHAFLEHLAKMGEPDGVINSDEQGHILDGALQFGFDYIDDDANLLAVHQNDLLKFTQGHRTVNKASRALKKLVAALEEMGIADPDKAVNGADAVDFLCQHYPALKAALS